MRTFARAALALSASTLFACAAPIPEPATFAEPAAAPLGEVGGDAADRSCQVVLRSVGRVPGGADFETECDADGCRYVWHGAVDVSLDAADVGGVGVLYHQVSDSTWWSVRASLGRAVTPGYRRWDFAMSEHLFGPADVAEPIELVAYVVTADGSRRFDHNRFSDDFENLVLDVPSAFGASDGGVCAPTVGTLTFGAGFAAQRSGELRQGGWLRIQYDIDRLATCRGTHNGHPAWDVVALGRFLPGGQPIEGSVRELVSNYGVPTNEAVDLPLVVAVPDDAEAVELWFHNFTGAGSSCEAWDSNYGSNYRFDVWPDASDPRCLDVLRETGARTEDPRMAHTAPDCLGYALDAQRDAPACGLVVQGFGQGAIGHYGIPFGWWLAHLRVGDLGGAVLGVGLYARFTDRETGAPGQRFAFGAEIEPGLWQVGLEHDITARYAGPGRSWDVHEVAFFADVARSDGRVERLWNSGGGANYDVAATMSAPPTLQSIPYGQIRWANDGAAVLASRHACLGW
ncbi:MAG: DUF6209 family protein [Sandaracinaceae bacterium]